VYANGTATCSARHASTQVYVTLKRDGVGLELQGLTFTNSFGFGSRSLSTGAYAPAGHCWQAVTQAWVSGLPYTYSTSLSPVCY
jgi:hypothetical protein